MNNQKVFQGSIIVLLVINLTVVLFMVFHQNQPPLPRSPKLEIIELLNLDADQQLQFEKLVELHQAQVRKQMEVIQSAREDFTENALRQNESVTDSIWHPLLEAYQGMEALHIEHLKAIKQLCHPHQLAQFEELVKRFPKFFQPPQPPRK